MYIQTLGLKGNTEASTERRSTTGHLGQPVVPSDKFDRCSDKQRKEIRAALVAALRSVNFAAAVLGSAYGRPDRITQRTKDLLKRHFRTVRKDDVLKIFRNIFRIGQALQKGLNISCMGYCGGSGWCGYAWATQWFGGRGPILICFDARPGKCSFTNLSLQEQTATIIHEAAHRYVGIDDKAYIWENSTNSSRDYNKLTPRQSMDNADSYALFCVELLPGP